MSEEKLCLAQEEQAANRSHQAGLEGKVQDLSQSHASLEQELGRRDQVLQQQAQALKELQRRHVKDSPLDVLYGEPSRHHGLSLAKEKLVAHISMPLMTERMKPGVLFFDRAMRSIRAGEHLLLNSGH